MIVVLLKKIKWTYYDDGYYRSFHENRTLSNVRRNSHDKRMSEKKFAENGKLISFDHNGESKACFEYTPTGGIKNIGCTLNIKFLLNTF